MTFYFQKDCWLLWKNNEYDQLQIVSEAVKEMSEGELLQLEKAKKLNITEEVYFDIIYKKTASLIASCTHLGAVSAKADEKGAQSLNEFGKYLGIAFQMKDDLFDYEKQGNIGKPTGNDIKEKKLTLPLIYTLRNCNAQEKKYILRTIKKHNKNSEKVNELIQFVKEKGGIEYTRNKMMEYKEKALQSIANFPDSEAKNSLTDLVEYTISRTK